MSKVRGKGNKSTEVRFRMALVRAGVAGWALQKSGLRGNPDFVFPDSMVAVFVDGCFWHGCPECGHTPKTHSDFWRAKLTSTMQRDAANVCALKAMGYEVLRFWEHELEHDVQETVNRTSSLVDRRSLTKRDARVRTP